MMQQWTMGLIVALAAMYLLWRCLPASLRQWLARLHPALARSASASGCAGCSRCAGRSGPEQPPDAARPVSMPGKGKTAVRRS